MKKIPSQLPSFVIRNASVTNSKKSEKLDVWVQNGKIQEIGSIPAGTGEFEIDAEGLHLLPGVFDPQVHFREPGHEQKEDLYTGPMAAVSGGVTSFLEMPNTTPTTTTPEALADKWRRAEEKSLANYGFFIGATGKNLDVINSVNPVPGIKIFMGSSTGSLLVDQEKDLDHIFGNGKKLIAVHSEDEATIQAHKEKYQGSTNPFDHAAMRPVEAAMKSTKLAVGLSQKYQRRLHVLHLTTQEEAEFLAGQKEKSPLSVEVCPQHLLLSGPEAYDRLGVYAQMNPPIREKRHSEALWKALHNGTIDCMATDHAPHTHEEKAVGFPKAPSGMPGVESLLPLMLDQVNKGKCSIHQIAQWLCEKPVELYGVKNKGHVLPGYDADLVLVDLKKTRKIENGKLYCKTNWSAFDGFDITGWPQYTIVGGVIAFREGDITGETGAKRLEFHGEWDH